MIIRKYDGSVWQEQYPKTTQDMIYDSSSVTTSLFDSNRKLKAAYLPNSVFDSLRYFSSFDSRDANTNAENDLIDTLKGIKTSASSASRSAIGYYIVFSYDGTIAEASSNTAGALDSNFIGQYTFEHGDSSATEGPSSVTVEAGDWAIIESASGSGTSGDPYIVTLSIVSNTYELYQGANNIADGSPGLVPAATSAERNKFLRGDGTYQTPTDTNTVTSVGVSGSETSGTVTFAASGAASISQVGSTVTISATNTNTTYTAGTGLTLTGTEFDVDLSELSATTSSPNALQDHIVFLDNGSQKKILFANVSNAVFNNGAGFTTNTGTVTSVATGHGLGGGTITGSGTITLDYPVYYADTQASLPTSGVSANAIGFEY